MSREFVTVTTMHVPSSLSRNQHLLRDDLGTAVSDIPHHPEILRAFAARVQN